MKTIKKLMFLFVFFVFASCLYTGVGVYAKDAEGNLSLHERTKIYSANNSDYFEGCEDFNDYRFASPAITVLTHGYGGNASHWSNNYYGQFVYQEESLITKIVKKSNADVYYARCTSQTSFDLLKCNWNSNFYFDADDYKNGIVDDSYIQVERINDVSKHIVVVFESQKPQNSNEYVYKEFENVVDSISLQYKSLTGKLPRINLVGHSRGGLTNIVYAAEHPYNVVDIYSLGTPYNGSTLGGCDFCLRMIAGVDSNEQLPAGIHSIMNQEEIKSIRNKWNQAYKSDVTCHVTAFGSITSIDYIRAFVEDVANGNSNYSDLVDDYVDLIGFITRLIDKFPHTTEFTLNTVEGLANVASIFKHNIYDDIVGAFKEEYKGDITVEEGNKILELYSVINDNKPVLLDDLFIDVNSQLGYFEDGDDFKGFNRYVKVFEPGDLTKNRSMQNQPAVVHNLEAFNSTYTDYITKYLAYGSSNEKVTNLEELGSFAGIVDGEKVLQFDANASGYRKIQVNCDYDVLDKNGRAIEIENNKMFLKNGTPYFIVLKTKNATSVNLTIDVAQEYGANKDFSNDSKQVFYVTNLSKGFYTLNSSDISTRFYDLEGNPICSIYSSGVGDKIYLIAESNKSNVTLSTSVPTSVNPDGVFRKCIKNEIYTLKNTHGLALKYEVVVKSGTNISFLDSNNKNVSASFLVENGYITYYITLNQNASLYFKADGNSSIKIQLADNQLYWFVDNTIITSSIYEVKPGSNYLFSLKLRNKESFEYVSQSFKFSNNTYGISSNEIKVFVSINALIGKSVVMSHKDYNEQLELKIVPTSTITWAINNGNNISVTWSLKYGTNQITRIDYQIISNTSQDKYTVGNYCERIDLNNVTKSNTFKIKIVKIYFENGSFESKYFQNVESSRISSFYASGSGLSNNPYLINCERHLKNISYHSGDYFKLTSNITLSTWTTNVNFSGTFDGNNKKLYYMNIECAKDKTCGLFLTNSGTIKSLIINHAVIVLKGELSNSKAGFFAGINYGIIDRCEVEYSSITANTTGKIWDSSVGFGSNVGGIAGYNSNSIKNCKVTSLTMEAAGVAGGVVGLNAGTVSSCVVSSINLTYNHVGSTKGNRWDFNGRVGGAVGYNQGTVESCTISGNLYWYNDDSHNGDNDREIYPSLGHVVGMNANGALVTKCNADGMSHHITYYYWNFIGWYDQSGRCFREENGMIGYKE